MKSKIQYYIKKVTEQNSQKAFKVFYDLTYDRLFRTAYFYLQNKQWSQEVVLDTFLKIWDHRAELKQIKDIESYCFIVVKNTALNYLAKERRRIDCSYSFFEGQVEQSSSPEELLISEELFQRYVKALDELPKRCREVFIRIREEKQSYAQVANELGISVKTVDAQLQKATKKLKQKLL